MGIAARHHLSVEVLLQQLNDLSRERQHLRADHADQAALEQNRLAIVEAQWQLSHALIRRYLAVDERAAA